MHWMFEYCNSDVDSMNSCGQLSVICSVVANLSAKRSAAPASLDIQEAGGKGGRAGG